MQQKNSQTLRNFQVIQKLGEGSYSQVFKVIRISDNQVYAMKKVKMNMLKEKEKENALNEVRILASFNDPYIVGYKEAFIDEDSQVLCIVMDFANDGDLQQLIQQTIKKGISLLEHQIWRALYQMTRGLKKLHDMKIVHRDLKCANVFIQDGVFQLGDLNVSKVAKKGLVYTQTGTPYYASPEVWRDEPYDMKSDIWSLGCVVYEMTALKPPFRSNDMQGLYKKVQKGLFDPIPKTYSKDLQAILTSMLQVQPLKRPTCLQLLNNPTLLKQIDELTPFDKTSGKKNELLQTIQLPRNLRALKDSLPKSKYKNSDLNRSVDNSPKNESKKQVDNPSRKGQRVQSAAPQLKSSNSQRTPHQQKQILPENYEVYPSAPRNSIPNQKPRSREPEPLSPLQHTKQNSSSNNNLIPTHKLSIAQKASDTKSAQQLRISPTKQQLVSINHNAINGNTPLKKLETPKKNDHVISSSERKSTQAQDIVKLEQTTERITQDVPEVESSPSKGIQIGETEQDGQQFPGLIVDGLHKLNPMSIQSILCQPVLNIEDYPFPIQAKVLKKKQVEAQYKSQPDVLPIKGIHNNLLQPLAQKQKLETVGGEYKAIHQPPTKVSSQTPQNYQSQNNQQRPESAFIVQGVQKVQDKYQHYYPMSQQQQLYLDKMKQEQTKSQQRIQDQYQSPTLNRQQLDRVTSTITKRQSSAQGIRNQQQKIYN